MRPLIITFTTAAALAVGCLVAGCATPRQQPPAPLGSAAPNAVASSSSSATPATPASGSATNADLTGARFAAAVNTAINQATALHLTGTVTAVSTPTTMDSYLNGNGTSSGTLGYMGATIPFRVVGGTDYFQLTPSLMALTKMTQTSAQGLWATPTSSVGDSLETIFSEFLTLKSFVKTQMNGVDATFTFVGLDQLGTQRVAVYHDTYQDQLGGTGSVTFDIAAAGAALPLKVSGSNSSVSSDMDMAWNHPTTVTAPPPSQIYTGS
jgi:hypothetical protein